MPTPNDPAIQSGAEHVEQTEELAHGYEAQRDPAAIEIEEQNGPAGGAPVLTHLNEMTLSMFVQGASTRVRVGNPHNSSELYEYAFASADEANRAMLDAGILAPEQVPNPGVPAGTGIALKGVTAEQLEAAGLKRHGASTL